MSTARGRGGAYRDGGARGGKASSEPGLVDEIVRQFADPYAFLRELVQNAIDAGASRIHVRVSENDAERGAQVAVTDDGSGMTQAILEEDLTVLFKSTKESRDDAIGKFGIGFVSVLALEPTLVAVDTSIGDGVRHRLELHPDHTYDLLRSSGGERGTTVTLHVPLPGGGFTELRQRCRAALDRWCGHATVPITYASHGVGEAMREPDRIDRPLAIEGALVHCLATSADGKTVVAMGLPSGEPRVAFFNRGLLLFEGTEVFPDIGPVSFKVADPRLEHTLSRDDVRRDAHFASVLAAVARAVRGPLTSAVAQALATDDVDRWRAVFDRAELAGLPLDRTLPVPLASIDPASVASQPDGARPPNEQPPDEQPPTEQLHLAQPPWAPLDSLQPIRALPAADRLIAGLAARGARVTALDASRDASRLAALSRRSGRPVVVADRHDAWVEPVRSPLEAAFPALLSTLGAVARRPSSIVAARFYGALAGVLVIGAAIEGPTWLGEADWAGDPFRLLLRLPLVIDVGHPVARAATAAIGHRPPRVVAALLARAILAQRGALDVEGRARWLDHVLREVGRSPRAAGGGR